MTGDTRYVGSGCIPANIPPATATVKIAIVHAFNCDFRAKTENVDAKGYTGLVMFAPSNAELGTSRATP